MLQSSMIYLSQPTCWAEVSGDRASHPLLSLVKQSLLKTPNHPELLEKPGALVDILMMMMWTQKLNLLNIINFDHKNNDIENHKIIKWFCNNFLWFYSTSGYSPVVWCNLDECIWCWIRVFRPGADNKINSNISLSFSV